MRAKQSSTASGIYMPFRITYAAHIDRCRFASSRPGLPLPGLSCSSSGSETPQDEGLLHDACAT